MLVKGGHGQGTRCIHVLLQQNLPAIRSEARHLPREYVALIACCPAQSPPRLLVERRWKRACDEPSNTVSTLTARSNDIEPKS